MSDKSHMTPGDVIALWRTMPEKQETIRNTYYDADIRVAAARFYQSAEFEAVLGIATSAGKHRGHVLDIGGGNGVMALAWHHAGYHVTMVEPDESDVVGLGAIAPVLIREKSSIDICCACGEKLPFVDATFDIVYCRQVLHHIEDLGGLTDEVVRVLKPGGVLIATREHVISSHEDLPTFLERHALHRYTDGENAYLESEYVRAMQAAGLHVIQVLKSYDSVINYFPMSEAEFRQRIARELCRFGIFYRLRLCGLLSHLRVVQAWAASRLSERDQTPGRMYSFIAVKH
jgi:ubiquinone/menaquinone biosynthesis C-methylase UbiE